MGFSGVCFVMLVLVRCLVVKFGHFGLYFCLRYLLILGFDVFWGVCCGFRPEFCGFG